MNPRTLLLAAAAATLCLAAPASGQNAHPLDADGDGKVSVEEWKESPEKFARLDIDGDGFLAGSELPLGRGGPSDRARNGKGNQRGRNQGAQNAQRAKQRFKRMDVNQDGKVAREEWKGRAQLFDRLDKNRDGFVTLDEVPGAKQAQKPKQPKKPKKAQEQAPKGEPAPPKEGSSQPADETLF